MIPDIKRPALFSGLVFALGFGFVPVGLGCGSSRAFGSALPAYSDAAVPASIAQQLNACAEHHKAHLGIAQHAISFEVQLSADGQVDAVTLKDSTLDDQGLEACMASALRSLSADNIPMRRSDLSSPPPVAPESRSLLGQEEVLLCMASPPCLLALGLLIGASFITVQIYLYTSGQSAMAKPRPIAAPIATTMPTVAEAEDEDDPCMPLLIECLENPWQPQWNRKTYGPRKDCNACYHDCKDHSKGVWPDKKCPRN